jgi:hypothetical protein
MTAHDDRGEQPLSLNDQATHLLNEGRMLLPGMQALFGFQLIAVFSQGFAAQLSRGEQTLHLAATVLLAIAVALVMTPAALHRQIEPEGVSEGLVRVSSRLLLWSLVPLAFGVSGDLYLVARVILSATVPAAVIAVGLLVVYLGLWFALPRSGALRRALGKGDGER